MSVIARISALLALLFLSSTSFAGIVFSNNIDGTNPNTSNPFTDGQFTIAGITASGIGRGPGITGSNANNRYTAVSWGTATFDSTAYFTFTLTPDAGRTLSLTSFTYTGQASGSGPTSFALRSSLSAFNTNIGSPTATGVGISLTDAAYQNLNSAVEFRLYGWNATAGTGTFSVNDFSFSGDVSSVPEPNSMMLAAIMLAMRNAFVRRFRRARCRSKQCRSAVLN
ncbi:MAG: hypothetical protein U0892_06815 [Pirellulales bacterium]